MDCVSGMKLLDNSFIDLTITSPPYDDIRDYNGYEFNFQEIAKELYRVTKDGGIVVWIVSDKTHNFSESGTSFRQALYFKEIGFKIYDTMIFAKKNPIPLNHRRYEQQFEYMFIFSKGKPSTFNPLKVRCKYAGRKKSGTFRHNSDGILSQAHKKSGVKQYKNRYNIWYYKVDNYSITEDKIAHTHPAIFPESLVEDHILSWSNSGNVVMDIFMGSGTVGKVALLNKRKFIGFEISKGYVEVANARIKIYKDK